jgi:hypothetical protein
MRNNLTLYKFLIFFLTFTFISLANKSGDDPITVYIDIQIVDIRNIKVEDQSFDCEFYLNLSWRGDSTHTAKNFEFINVNNFDISHYEETLGSSSDTSAYTNISCKVKGNFRSKMDVFNYPFDEHRLVIEIGDYDFAKDELIYSGNDSTTDLHPIVELLEWKIEPRVIKFEEDTYTYSDSDEFSIAKFIIAVNRKPMSFVIKILLPIVIIMSIALLVLFIRRRELGTRTALAVTALLSLIALYITISNHMPEVSYMSKVDLLFIWSYFIILVIMIFAVMGFKTAKDQKEDSPLDKYLRWILPTIYFSFIAILFAI